MDEPRPTDDEVQHQLAAILDSPVFTIKKKLPDMLSCIVDHWLKREEINEEVLLIELFSEGSAETIVRNNASNLRTALAEYYDNEGRREQIRISVPRGGYNADIYYSAAIRERAELDQREAALRVRESEIKREHAEFDRKVEEAEALYAKREALNAARHADVDRKLAALETKLVERIEKQASDTERLQQEREKRIRNEIIANGSPDGGF